MKFKLVIVLTFISWFAFSQETDSTSVSYKKRVLESTEIDYLMSYYNQDGVHASVTGGIGTEKLQDITPTIVVAMPINDDDVLTVNAGISAYTSASSSNLNPFDRTKKVPTGTTTIVTGASSHTTTTTTNYAVVPTPTPWAASSGASASDVWKNITADYSHSSDDRNTIVNVDASISSEFDYNSFGFGGGLTKLFNDKNTTLNISTKIFLDKWNPRYPTELDSYYEANQNLNAGFFSGVTIYDQSGTAINKSGSYVWSPYKSPFITDKSRNSYSLSFTFSQVLNKYSQFSLFFDLVQQKGWLSNPMQRVYFADIDNFYIGNPSSIPYYTSSQNQDVFQLADDIERLPSTRFKIPLGIRWNYYLNERLTLRTYYRYYWDDWGIQGHTASIEIPVKLSDRFTVYPMYRYYNQTKAKYFAPYETHLSTEQYYTSDYDLSAFNANQYGVGISYTDIFMGAKVWKFGLKNIDFRYNHYRRSNNLDANIFSFAIKFVQQ